MGATFVNGAGGQHFFATDTVTFVETVALAVTAGNFLSVMLRLGSGEDPGNITISDTAGNTFRFDGSVTSDPSDSRLFAYSAQNCLGDAANVVRADFPAHSFVAINQSQYSGMPTSTAADVVQVFQATGGTTITIAPASIYTEQLVIMGVDLANSGHSTPNPAVFTLLYQSTYDGGAPVGVGSHDVWRNINTTRMFDGSVSVVNTFTGAFATAGVKSALAVIYRPGVGPGGIPVSTPMAAQTPCVPQAQVTNGGRGNAGCNVGGIGGGHQYVISGSPPNVGDVPQHPDPDDGEILTGDVTRSSLEPWIEVVHTDYPSDVQVTYRRAFEELADDSDYEGGRKESGVLAIGDIEHGLGNDQGGFEAGTATLQLSDIRDRLFRTLATDQELDGDEYRVKLASDAARAAGTVPRVLQRGIVQQAALESTLEARLTGVDWLFSDFGPFGPGRKDPNWTFGDLGDAAPDMTSDTKTQPIPLLYGEKSDEGATPNAKGLLPGYFLGRFDLTGLVPDPPASTGRTLEEVVALLQASVTAGTTVADWSGIIGVADAINLEAMGTVPSDYTSLANVIGYGDLDTLLAMGSTAPPAATEWGFLATGLGPWFQYTGVYGSDLGCGNALQTHDRIKLDPATRADVLVPGINWPFATPYFELTNPDTGRTFRLTGIFAMGPLLDDHLNGVVNFAFNAIGIEAIGDGSGLPILRIEDAKQHRLENHWINQYSSGLYATDVVYPQFEDGVAMVRSSSFTTRQQFFKDQLGSEGILVSEYAETTQSNLEIVKQWNQNTESRLGVNQHGQIMDWGFDETVDPSVWPRLDHVTEIFGPMVRTSGDERENVVSGSCDWDPDFDKDRAGPFIYSSAAGIQKYKGRIRQGDPIESRILDDTTHFQWILQRRLTRLQFGLTMIEVTVPIDPWLNYDVGEGVLLNSEDGTGAAGYVDEPCIILRRRISLQQRLMTLTLWDVRDLLGSP